MTTSDEDLFVLVGMEHEEGEETSDVERACVDATVERVNRGDRSG